ncbi:antifungal protein ginkbilobin-like protein 1 [Ipomoea triloba]|uniref:antifungal protein ginkbilobin-like protein 1 n=1 Tax=Ipomoea triloba TaxID=35885 RepID=UPI00125DEE43|nr:antifungal protein ginkbilobin-like protein 1 [Ipomoea triloba]
MRFLAAVLMLWMIGSAHSSDETISYGCNAESYREGSGFDSSLGYVFVDLVNSTPVSLGFDLYDVSPPSTGGPPVYGHGRCLNSMSAAECFSCLGRAKDIVSVCCDLRIGGWVLIVGSCYMRYESYAFR